MGNLLNELRQILLPQKQILLQIELASLLRRLNETLGNLEGRTLSLLYLESLILFSFALYRKSELIFKTYFPSEEGHSLPEENPPSTLELNQSKALSLALPFDRRLDEEVFLPKINGFWPQEERGSLKDLLKAIIDLIQRSSAEILEFNPPEKGIIFYLEDVYQLVCHQGRLTLRALVQQFEPSLTTLVYLFLALLFLAFEGKVRLFQQDEDIEILLRVT